MVNFYKALLLVLSFAFTGTIMASTDPVPMAEKKKMISKSYPLSSDENVTLNNKFGSIKINTWGKNEFKIEITITAEARSEDRAQDILDGITISEGKGNGGVYVKTNIRNNNNNSWDKGEKTGFQINYDVYMPAKNELILSNEFGPVTMGDHSGLASLVVKFGSLNAGKLSNAKKVQVEFGSLQLDGMNNGNLVVKFSQAEVRRVSGDITATFEHSGGTKLVIDNDIKKLTIKNSFTPLLLDLASNLNASFDIHTSFAKVKNKSNFNIAKDGDDDEDRRGPKFDFDWKGKAGNGDATIKVKADFGDVTLGHNLPFKVEEKKGKTKDI